MKDIKSIGSSFDKAATSLKQFIIKDDKQYQAALDRLMAIYRIGTTELNAEQWEEVEMLDDATDNYIKQRDYSTTSDVDMHIGISHHPLPEIKPVKDPSFKLIVIGIIAIIISMAAGIHYDSVGLMGIFSFFYALIVLIMLWYVHKLKEMYEKDRS